MEQNNKTSNFTTLLGIAFTCIFMGGFIGAITNMINGVISPIYFKIVMNWDFNDIWPAAVAQGIFEGLIYGFIFSLIFTISFGIITKGIATYNLALKLLLKITLQILICWIIGGLIALFLAYLSPEFYKSHFYYVPPKTTEMLKYAWVGGSIWGGMVGGILNAFFSVVIIKNSWNK